MQRQVPPAATIDSMEHGPARGCVDVRFAEALALDPAAEVALEDYARALLEARTADAASAPDGKIAGIHVCGAELAAGDAMRADVEAFARDMAQRSEGGGLGWS